jgi:hypothetical protein
VQSSDHGMIFAISSKNCFLRNFSNPLTSRLYCLINAYLWGGGQ